jgi:hypothetical protein
LALSLLAAGHVADMRDSAAELFELCKGLSPSPDFLPVLSDSPNTRQHQLLRLLLIERERSRRLLRLLGSA